jgi:predicted NUDIX family phosphoesterase
MEFVYVVKRYDLFDLEFPHGFRAAGEEGFSFQACMDRILRRGFFMERRFAENDSGFKQIIPYSLLVHDDRVLLLTRTSKQGEARLHHKKSVGVGGHINPVDGLESPLQNACRREIEEELQVDEAYEPAPIGIINDDSNPVGSVHFGVVHAVRLKLGKVRVREQAMMTASMVPMEDLAAMAERKEENFETWSSLIIASMNSWRNAL